MWKYFAARRIEKLAKDQKLEDKIVLTIDKVGELYGEMISSYALLSGAVRISFKTARENPKAISEIAEAVANLTKVIKKNKKVFTPILKECNAGAIEFGDHVSHTVKTLTEALND